jgi:hypothetical protein
MPQERHYRIDYLLDGAYKSFYIRTSKMNNTLAWHWATVDAGFGQLPKYRSDPVTQLSKPQAERLGITNVEWNEA